MSLFRAAAALSAVLPVLALATQSVVKNKFEKPPAGEVAKIKEVKDEILKRLEITRDAHAKTHGCVDGVQVKILKTDANLQKGYFSEVGKTYDAIVRLSPGDGKPKSDDRRGGGMGFAVKFLLKDKDVESLIPVFNEKEYFVAKNLYQTFDILTISELHEFFVETMDDYPAFSKATRLAPEAAEAAAKKVLEAKGTLAEAEKAAGAAALQVLKDEYLEPAKGKKRPREAALLGRIGAVKPKNVLELTYGSWVPSLLGEDQAVKYQIEPCEKPTKAYEIPKGVKELENWQTNPNFIAEVLKYELTQKKHCFILSVQLHKDGFPSVEDAVAPWPVDKSPWKPIAEITFPKKDKGKELVDNDICEQASFHPGHSSAVHYPIGGIQRGRVGAKDDDGKPFEGIYTMTARERNKNRAKLKEKK